MSEVDKFPDRRYIEKLWELNSTENPVDDQDSKKKQFAYKIWKEDSIYRRRVEDSKENESKQLQLDIYQLIGFYSVFQGVWFQGVTSLAQQVESCRASVIPIVLSVLVSIATIIGVHLKLSELFYLKKSFFKDKLLSDIREHRLNALESQGLDFEFKSLGTETSQGLQASVFEKELEKLHRTRLVLLLFLTVLSILFPWLIGAIMCDKFP